MRFNKIILFYYILKKITFKFFKTFKFYSYFFKFIIKFVKFISINNYIINILKNKHFII